MKNGIHKLVCLVAVAAGLAVAAPVLQHKVQESEEQTMTLQEEALKNLRHHMLITLKPSIENKRWLRVNKSQYDGLRTHRGYRIDMDEHIGLSTTTIREGLRLQVESNINAIDKLLFSTNLYSNKGGFKLNTFEMINEHYNFESESLSPEVQVLALDMAGGADALMRGKTYNDLSPRYFLYDSKGKMSAFEERQFTYKYHEMYKEYWVDYFLNDDAHIYRSKYDKIHYQYIF